MGYDLSVSEGISAAADRAVERGHESAPPIGHSVLVTIPWGTAAGGAETMLQSILDGAAEGPFEFELVFFEDGPWPRKLAAEGFAVTVLPVGRLRQIRRFLGAVRRLGAIMRARRPALILNWSAKTQLYGAPAAMLAGMSSRVLWWQHNIPDGSAIDRLATALPARAVFCCSAAAERAQRRMRPRRVTVPVAPGSPAPGPQEQPAAIGLPPGVPVVGIVGRLEEWKGQDRLLRSQALLRAEGVEMHCLIVGGDAYELAPEYAASLSQLVEDLGLEGHVTLTGQVPDAGPYMEHMDVLVNASDPEPFGIVLLEGMARGVAVLAVDSGGPSEFIEHMRTGVLAPSGDPVALARALEPLLRTPELRVRLAAAGRESFVRDYTDAAMRSRLFAGLASQLPAPNAAQPA